MVISMYTILHIESALGLKLYDNQKRYLMDEAGLVGGRRTGKTTAYCIKLALSEGEPLNMDKPEEFADGWELGDQRRYAKAYFRRAFLDIREALKGAGLPVRDIKGKDITEEYTVALDEARFQTKGTLKYSTVIAESLLQICGLTKMWANPITHETVFFVKEIPNDIPQAGIYWKRIYLPSFQYSAWIDK
jgi:hypothetical protein